jgi:hypothetical protein
MCDVEWSVSSHRQTRFKQLLRSAMQRFSKPLPTPIGSHGLDLAATSSYPHDTTVTVPPQQATFEPSNTAPFRLSTEGLVLRKSRTSVNAFRCFFAEGEIGGTPCMRSHIFIHLATTISFAKPFIFKIKIEKEGLPRDSPAGLGAGGPEFKSRRPDHLLLCFQWTVPDGTASRDELGSNLGPNTSLSTLSTARRCSSGIACK